MNKIGIIIQREFYVRLKKKSFILLTIIMPFLMAAFVFVPALLSNVTSNQQNTVAVVDLTGKYSPLLKSTPRVTFKPVTPSRATKDIKQQTLQENSGFDALLYIPKDLTHATKGAEIYTRSEVPFEVENTINIQLTEIIRNDRLSKYNIDNIEQVINDAYVHSPIQTIRWNKSSTTAASSSEVAGMVGLILSLFIYMFILSYGSMVMQGVMEEKTNRIVEIMVSSVKPYQLMFGKITGIALVGLFQLLIWTLMLFCIMLIASNTLGISSVDSMTPMPANMPSVKGLELLEILQGMNLIEFLVLFILYFIGGYLLFAAIFAAVGASINEQQDSQQFMMPIILIFVFALYAGMFSIRNPDGPLALWCSFIPFTSPVVMMVRIPFNTPLWQIALSLVILYATSAFIIWLSARIYRIGILMYGKKPTFKEMLKWINYK